MSFSFSAVLYFPVSIKMKMYWYTSGRVISDKCRCQNVGRRLTSNIREYSLNVEDFFGCFLNFSRSCCCILYRLFYSKSVLYIY